MPVLMRDDENDKLVVLTRELVREALLASALGTEDAIDEYMNEFEHQEGDDCWSNFFKTTAEVINDFGLYTTS